MAKRKVQLSGKGSNIHVQRIYAKRIGVKAPTRLPKAQLDEAVRRREIELGLTRHKFNLYDFTFEERCTLVSNAAPRTHIQMFAGYFCPFREGDGVLRRDPFRDTPEADVYVSAEQVKSAGMVAGDRVVGDVGLVPGNRIKVLRRLRYLNEEPVTKRIGRVLYDDLAAYEPSIPLGIESNNAVVKLLTNILSLVGGRSVCITSVSNSDTPLLEQTAVDILKGLYMSFGGEVFGIFETMHGRAALDLEPLLNPEAVILDGDRTEYPYMLEMMKRSVERGIPAVAVIYAPCVDVSDFVEAVKATETASLTVIVVGGMTETDGRMIIKDGVVLVDELVSAGRSDDPFSQKKLERLKKDGTPDELLMLFAESGK